MAQVREVDHDMSKYMFCNHKHKIGELEQKIDKLEREQMDFLIHAQNVLNTVLDNDKRKFMYEIMEQDVELIEEGKKMKAIRKIINKT